jgi:hypothetical protein
MNCATKQTLHVRSIVLELSSTLLLPYTAATASPLANSSCFLIPLDRSAIRAPFRDDSHQSSFAEITATVGHQFLFVLSLSTCSGY